jgi:hypothetical protein
VAAFGIAIQPWPRFGAASWSTVPLKRCWRATGTHPWSSSNFPTWTHARAWYHSPDYQQILPLRTENPDTTSILVDGVRPGHRATELLKACVDGRQLASSSLNKRSGWW